MITLTPESWMRVAQLVYAASLLRQDESVYLLLPPSRTPYSLG